MAMRCRSTNSSAAFTHVAARELPRPSRDDAWQDYADIAAYFVEQGLAHLVQPFEDDLLR